ncbi:unnamed protein product [Nippostrongylus brasiliensis]|uniref:Tyrosine-protein kinase n=1 Tax=Nippostrongylus brasiliensis TaxID=27835 RepID=A0A0N4XY71_NIPBR|nr:unnamed protein product [Nippostrongylus brasiliensis]
MDSVELDVEAAKKTADNKTEKDEEKELKEFKFYHGFLPREDLLFVLKNEGDYLLRVDVDASMSKRAIILSVLTANTQGEVPTASASIKLKNIIIRKHGTRYYVETSNFFDTIKELVEYYQAHPAQTNKAKFVLKNPVFQQRWEFQHSDVQLGRLIGEGEYGEVREGTLKRRQQTIEVAIKLTKGTGDMSKEKIKEMMREARLIRNFKHRNIVRLYGVAVDEQPLYILLELKMNMCKGAAQGVEYLHKQSCIHMDLAARNCLYSEDKMVKISDFGLSRLGTNYTIRTSRKLPIKWLAPETILTFTFSLKTDVFSYGVMVFEIFTNGKEPWDGYSNTEVKKGLVEGKVLALPDSCPEDFRNFVRDRIYVKDPNTRVTMSEPDEKSVFERMVAESPPKVVRTGGGDDMKETAEVPEKVKLNTNQQSERHTLANSFMLSSAQIQENERIVSCTLW